MVDSYTLRLLVAGAFHSVLDDGANYMMQERPCRYLFGSQIPDTTLNLD